MSDILAAVAPRPLFVSQEVRSDLDKAHHLLAPARRAYKGFDAAEQLTEYYDEAPRHRFVGEPLYRWIRELWPDANKKAAMSKK